MLNLKGYLLFLVSHICAVILGLVAGSMVTGYLYASIAIMAVYLLGSGGMIWDEIQSDDMEFDGNFVRRTALSVLSTPLVPILFYIFPIILPAVGAFDRAVERIQDRFF